MCPRTACSITPTGESCQSGIESGASKAATAISPRSGPARRARQTSFAETQGTDLRNRVPRVWLDAGPRPLDRTDGLVPERPDRGQPDHDWEDYRTNWESTPVASLLQPDVWQYEVAPWPERVFGGRYPKKTNPQEREPIPPAYATELQTVFNALNDLPKRASAGIVARRAWASLRADRSMFQRGEPAPSEPALEPCVRSGPALVEARDAGCARRVGEHHVARVTRKTSP